MFHSSYEGKSIDDIYTDDEAIERLKKLQEGISDQDYFYFLANIALNGADDVNVIGTLIQQELKDSYKIGDVIKTSLSNTEIAFKVVGVLDEDTYTEDMGTDFSTLTIPEIYFDAKAKTKEEKMVQKTWLDMTMTGMAAYHDAQEYTKIEGELKELTDKTGLQWKLEPKDDNRYAEIEIKTSARQAKMSIAGGIVFLLGMGIYLCKKVIKKDQIETNILGQTKTVLREILNVVLSYVIVMMVGSFWLRDQVYQSNMLEEKGAVVFWLIVYLFVIGTVVCHFGKRGEA